MVVSAKNEIFEIAKRKFAELCGKNPKYIKLWEELKMQRENDEKTAKIPQVKPPVESTALCKGHGCAPACIGPSIIDILSRRPKLFTFKDACAILAHFDMTQNLPFIEEIIERYGMVITGLPECTEDDLELAVYFFIEDMFGIQPKIEFCFKLVENRENTVTGVLFESITTKRQIIEKYSILEGSGIDIDPYFDMVYIENYINFAESIECVC